MAFCLYDFMIYYIFEGFLNVILLKCSKMNRRKHKIKSQKLLLRILLFHYLWCKLKFKSKLTKKCKKHKCNPMHLVYVILLILYLWVNYLIKIMSLNFLHLITFSHNLFKFFLLFLLIWWIYYKPLCCFGAVYWKIFFLLPLFFFFGARKFTLHTHTDKFYFPSFFLFLRLSFEFSFLFFFFLQIYWWNYFYLFIDFFLLLVSFTATYRHFFPFAFIFK